MTREQIQALDDCREAKEKLISFEKEVDALLNKYASRFIISEDLFKRKEINKTRHDLRCEVKRAIRASVDRIEEIIDSI